MSKDVYYFSHDCNARNDPKILALRSVYGVEGYAFYFMLLEIFREQENYKLKKGKYLYKMLSMQTGIDEKTVEDILNDCLSEFTEGDSALLKTDGDHIWSESFIRRMEMKDEFKCLMSELGKKGAEKRWRKGDRMAAYGIKEKESKENQSKEKESKEKEIIYEGGGGGGSEPDPVENYFYERSLDPDAYFGANDQTKKDAELLTRTIWKRFTPDRTPTDVDFKTVFRAVIDRRLNEAGEREGFISKDKTGLLLYAFEASVRAGKPGNWNYIEGVLNRLSKMNVKDLKSASDHDIDRMDRET